VKKSVIFEEIQHCKKHQVQLTHYNKTKMGNETNNRSLEIFMAKITCSQIQVALLNSKYFS